MSIRYFASVRFVSNDGSIVAERLDEVAKIFVSEREASLAGDLVAGDVIECSIAPGGLAHDVLLSRRTRRLPVLEAAK